MRIRFNKRIIERLETQLLEAQKLNNLRLYKIVKAMLLIADEHPIGTIAKLLKVISNS